MCMLELMHTASLIHDDVVDSADKRRNVPTITATSGRQAAVQCGDYLLAKAMERLSLYRGSGINETLAQVSSEMCFGEFYQQRTLFSLHAQTLETYYDQIRRKTACLLPASCYTGALSGRVSQEKAGYLAKYGEYLGLAFQIKDDILDFCADPGFGKKAGQDLRNGIFTLPILLVKEELRVRLFCGMNGGSRVL